MAEKDAAEKALEAYNDVFADIVNVLVFKGQSVVREEELEQGRDRSVYTGEKRLRDQERDTTKYWKKNKIRIALFGLENETEPEDDMPFRVIGYDGASYRDQIQYVKTKNGTRKKILDRYPVITLVLYMGYEKQWDKAKSIYEALGKKLDASLYPVVNDYRINLYEIAFLEDDVVSRFTSDFRFVADYLVQKRKTGTYIGSEEDMIHICEVTQLLSSISNDKRYGEAVILAKEEGKEIRTMDAVLDEIEKRGIKTGIETGIKTGIERCKEELILTMLKKGKTPAEIHDFCDIPIKEIELIEAKTDQMA